MDKRLAAYVNILPKSSALYFWKGELEESTEILLLVKTRTSKIGELSNYVRRGRRGWMLACSLGDRSRGILNGNPNTELPGAPGLAWRSDPRERLSLAPGPPTAGRPSAAPKCHFQLEEQPLPWDTSLTKEVAPTSCSFPLSSLCSEGLNPTTSPLGPPE
ncbi:protein CutA isoform X2 [Anomalospiza imberbis]|uniref:protein CutA isoform X2 n=1 Tax=Anomalospiza imberbis TaxID=187417 RepID=UPI003590183D